ncbi:metallophosphoesterase [Prolixibacteraceae bacterium Z1-6]|uniref:Metallophosphoesterase n=1 Tax=Draconibacterium aestuarii TaxID=2998507 RepID=A0A9X3J730_9BACT|nr:metallophosphoesterase [Prolixibacteraceae bacterium Z1-6]
MYDIIGDVHGHAPLLKKLLLKMGYVKTNGSFSHPSRKAVFVGDFINRGPEIRKTIKIIRSMVDGGNALAVLGNHEINAIIFHLKDKQGVQLVNKPSKYFLSLFKTINEYSSGSLTWKDDLKWLRTLPLYIDLGEIRIVHACWSEEAIKVADSIYENGKIKKKTFRTVHKKPGSEIAKSIWMLTKGVNLKMPSDLHVVNNKGVSPRSIRMCWWDDAENKTFKELSFESKFVLPNYTVPCEILPETYPYPDNAPIVFFGHYCRGKGPFIIKPNVCCVDSCVTGAGKLLAYRWNGEKVLNMSNLIQV